MKYLAFCPMETIKSEAMDAAMAALKPDYVVVVSQYGHKVVPFTKPSANAYGYDLYLYQINDDDSNTLIDSGSFN